MNGIRFTKKMMTAPDEVHGWQTTLKAGELLILDNGTQIFNPENRRVRICIPQTQIENSNQPTQERSDVENKKR